VFACASVHTGLRACMCVRAGMRACTCARMQGWVHANMHEECACVVSIPASSPPWKPSVGLACMHCSYSNSGAPDVAASEAFAVEHWLLLNHVRDSLPQGTQLFNSTKIICKSCPDTGALDFCGLEGQWKFALYICRLKFTDGHTNTDTEKIYVYIRIYVRYMYIRRIYILIRFWPTLTTCTTVVCAI